MRIAVIADIHGNLPAFEAVLADLRHKHVDRLIIAGDVVNCGPDSLACWELACSLGCPILRGNHERYVALYNTPAGDPAWLEPQFAPVRWAAAQFSDAERPKLWQLPAWIRLEDAPDVLIVHGSLRDDRDAVHAATSDAELLAMFPDTPETTIVRGHQHTAAVRLWGHKTIITAGAVGLALTGLVEAQYVILERTPQGWSIQHQSIPYDVVAAVQRFHSTGYLEEAGPVARLYMREVATSSYQIVPFLRLYRQWRTHTEISLAAAVERFLHL